MRWPEAITFGMALFVLLCWIATSSRHIRVIYVILLFAAAVWGVASLRFTSLRVLYVPVRLKPDTTTPDTTTPDTTTPDTTYVVRDWVVTFAAFYVFAYLLILPPAGAAVLPLPPDGAVDLVTYARYARQLM